MRGSHITIVVALLSFEAATSCSPTNTTPPPAVPAADQAAAAAGKIALLIKDVRPSGYTSGIPSQCTISYDIFNNTQYHLYKASSSVSDIDFDVSDMSANSHYQNEQTISIGPINNSCAGVVDKIVGYNPKFGVTDCSMESVTEGDCQSRFSLFISIDVGYKAKVQQMEAAAAQQFAAEQAKQFELEKAQAWAERGQYEFPVGTVLVSTNPGNQLPVSGVTAPDFDPTKIDDTTPVATSAVSLCSDSNPVDGNPLPNLYTSIIYKDKYGLADWYKFIGRCSKSREAVVWIKASAIDNLIQSGQIQKLSVTR